VNGAQAGELDVLLGINVDDPTQQLAIQLVEADANLLSELVDARKAAGLSRADVADRMGIRPKDVGELESMGSDPCMSTLRRYALAIGVNVKHHVDSSGGVDPRDAAMTATFELPNGQVLHNVHLPEACAGRACCIHNPSDHHMRAWPQLWRDDRGLMERTCIHGIGHPDPDHMAYILRFPGPVSERESGVHGCDGCCSRQPRGGPQWYVDDLLTKSQELIDLAAKWDMEAQQASPWDANGPQIYEECAHELRKILGALTIPDTIQEQ
jgi:transcriptional regulator with XRE-family HTH domain